MSNTQDSLTDFLNSGSSFKMPCLISIYENFKPPAESLEVIWVHQGALGQYLEGAILRGCDNIATLEVAAISEAVIQRRVLLLKK